MQFAKRPWGFWLTLYKGKHFKIKLIRFKIGKSLSLQRHEYRSELWVFLSGKGVMLNAGAVHKGDYAFIQQGAWHKFIAGANTWVLEIQYGEKCEEIDIERK
mgnify:CR=1 FL=1